MNEKVDMNDDFLNEILDGDPIEYLVQIIQNASLQSTINSIDKYLEEVAMINLILEQKGIDIQSEINKLKNDISLKDKIKKEKDSIALLLMSEVLIQE